METLAPTSEQLSRGHWQKPQRDQKTNQEVYRKLSHAARAHRDGDIDDAQFSAAEKLYQVLRGAEGCDVRKDDRPSSYGVPDEFAQVKYGRDVRDAKAAIGNRLTWEAVLDFVEERRDLVDIGRSAGVRSNVQQTLRGVGLGIIKSGLDTLAALWGIAQRRPPP